MVDIIIGWFSCGVTSAVAVKLAIEKYGDAVIPYYIHIDSAHHDNTRFIQECELWYNREIKTIKSTKYVDQFDVIAKTRYINGPAGARCTAELKKAPRRELQAQLNHPKQVFGFEFSQREINRAIRFREQNPEADPLFPLIDAKLNKEDCMKLLQDAGIELPVMYRLGFDNNNCIGCVKGGKHYWANIRLNFGTYFNKMAALERQLGRTCIRNQWLDELDGKYSPEPMPDCGSFCDIQNAEIIDPLTLEVLEGRRSL